MNGYRVAVFGPISRITALITLALFISGGVSARELAWKPHRFANDIEKPRRLDAAPAKPLASDRTEKTGKLTESASASRTNQPAVVKLKAEQGQENALEPIPANARYPQAASYQQTTACNPSSQSGTRIGCPVPNVSRCAPSGRSRGYVVQPWHPDALYAASGAGLRVAHHSESSVLSPEQLGPEEITPEEIGPGGIIEPEIIGPIEPGTFGSGCCGDCDAIPCECDPCDPMCDPDWGYTPPCNVRYGCSWLQPTLEFATFSAGVDGFSAPPDRGINGNFGVNESVNLSGSWLGGMIGWQAGARFIQSDFNGFRTYPSSANTPAILQGATEYRSDHRHQDFVTLGLFRRSDECQPWEGGVAIDFMEDHYYYTTDLSQLRIEFSRRFWRRLNFGTWLVFSTDTEPVVEEHRPAPPASPGGLMGISSYEAYNQYTLFLRWEFPNGGEIKFYGGASGNRNGIIGGNFWTPMSHRFALAGNFGYLLNETAYPLTSLELQKPLNDAYGISINLMWYPRMRARLASESLYRPLFPVANNGNFFIKRN